MGESSLLSSLFLCVYVSVLPIDTQKGINRPLLLRDTHQGLLHISFLVSLSISYWRCGSNHDFPFELIAFDKNYRRGYWHPTQFN